MRRPYLLSPFCLLAMPFLLLLPLLFFGCSPSPNFWTDARPEQKKILVSFAPLYSFTHAVAGDKAYVLCLLTTQGPHDYEGTQTDLFKVNKADLFIYNGLTLDDKFTEKMLRNHKNKNLVTLNVGAVLDQKHHDLVLHGKPIEHVHADGKMHKHGGEDPHIWLGPKQAIAMTQIIAGKLKQIDAPNAKGYEERAAHYIKELEALQTYGEAAFKNKKNKKIITMHEAFGYFAKAFGLQIAGTIQKMPGADPDAVSMAKLVKLCESDKIEVIAVEKQYSPAQAEALRENLKRRGIKIQIITLDPLETTNVAKDGKHNPDPTFYVEGMRANIDTLAKALP